MYLTSEVTTTTFFKDEAKIPSVIVSLNMVDLDTTTVDPGHTTCGRASLFGEERERKEASLFLRNGVEAGGGLLMKEKYCRSLKEQMRGVGRYIVRKRKWVDFKRSWCLRWFGFGRNFGAMATLPPITCEKGLEEEEE